MQAVEFRPGCVLTINRRFAMTANRHREEASRGFDPWQEIETASRGTRLTGLRQRLIKEAPCTLIA